MSDDVAAVTTGEEFALAPAASPPVAPPRAHGEQPLQRAVGPLELLYDLVVVALIAQAAHQFAGQLSWHGLSQYCAVFALVWIAWIDGSLHHAILPSDPLLEDTDGPGSTL